MGQMIFDQKKRKSQPKNPCKKARSELEKEI